MASHMIVTTKSGAKHKVDFDTEDAETANNTAVKAAEQFFNAVSLQRIDTLHLNNIIFRTSEIETIEFF